MGLGGGRCWASLLPPAAWKMTVQPAPAPGRLRVAFFSPSPARFQVCLCHQGGTWPSACRRVLQATAIPAASVSWVGWALSWDQGGDPSLHHGPEHPCTLHTRGPGDWGRGAAWPVPLLPVTFPPPAQGDPTEEPVAAFVDIPEDEACAPGTCIQVGAAAPALLLSQDLPPLPGAWAGLRPCPPMPPARPAGQEDRCPLLGPPAAV